MTGSELLLRILAIGTGATLATDLWALGRRHLLGIPALDYALVGRWIGHMRKRRFRHPSIAGAAPVPGEAAIGWAAHYAIGVAFAAILVAIGGAAWLFRPTLGLALVVGLATSAAPLLVLQPAFGLGIAASRVPRPWHTRLHVLLTHAVFGLGLYASTCLYEMSVGG